jgi:hypothetical protein
MVKKVVLPFQVDAGVYSDLTEMYREFTIKQVPVTKPVHAEFEAQRALAIAYAQDFCSKYSEKTIVLGNATLNAALSGNRSVHCEMSYDNPVAVHAQHESSLVYSRMARVAGELRETHALDIMEIDYRAYLTGKAFQVCADPSCKQKAGAYVVDGSMYPMSVDQFTAGMMSSEADVGVMLVPYHPDMFREKSGVLPACGVGYAMHGEKLNFMYPEGLAGATGWDLAAWTQWLASSVHTVKVRGEELKFMIELRAFRGVFLFATVVRIAHDASIGKGRLTHALELNWPREMYVCRHYQLQSLDVDPTLVSSWVPVVDYFPAKVVKDLYHHALGLPQERFSWEALLKRALVVDGRVTYQGSGVKVQKPLSDEDARKLTFLVYSRAFVDRYKMGRLGSEMTKMLSSSAAFPYASFSVQCNLVLMQVWRQAWGGTGAVIVNYLRDLVVGLLDSVRGNLRLGAVEFLPAPAFVTYESYASGLAGFWDYLWQAKGAHVTVPGVRGDVVAWSTFGGPGRSVGAVEYSHPELKVHSRTGVIIDDIVEMVEPGEVSVEGQSVTEALAELNQMGRSPFDRLILRTVVAVPEVEQTYGPVAFNRDDGFVQTINEVHEAMFPGMALQDFEQDARSLATGGQDRIMETVRMKIPYVGTVESGESVVYKSVLKTYPVEKRAQTAAELLSALAARTLTTPVLSTAQDDAVLIPKIWDNFLDMACVPGAREKIAGFKADTVGLEREMMGQWTKKARPEALSKMLVELGKHAKSLEEMDVAEYFVMLKTDAKPPMSDKPMREQVAPQVIVYHDKALSALYSSIFRVLVRRFLSLLKPEWMVNLLKDGEGIRDHIAANHPWGKEGLQYLENDFSKYDKSQHEFAFMLEHFVFQQLGMNQELLNKWTDGHEVCNLRSVSLGISLTVHWQRKSGDATTAFGNVILNILSVCYAYVGSNVEWAVFMGDDSLVCCSLVCATPQSLQVLAEVFNLSAKFYLGSYPYFASNFILLNGEDKQVTLAPDPVKRIQRWAVSIPARDPRWEDKYRSQAETCEVYRHQHAISGLEQSVRARYPVPVDAPVGALFPAIATAVSTFEDFRSMYGEEPIVVDRVH